MRLAFSCVITTFCLALAPAHAAWAQSYPFELARADPLAFAAWRWVVPAQFRNTPWIGSLNGAAGLMSRVTMRQKLFYYGKVCIAYDCRGNFAAFLIAADGSEAAGLVQSRALGVGNLYFGAPDDEARQLLVVKILQ
ncbi:Ivy family c-type lysozyme inhibitor [Rhodoblastus sp.]|uniref:Ivy family c-type lysozyme inhibitor n=1 Tax=Rhodoblastus sp. TaxID=1962975 RepID=UPI003F960B57